MVWLHLPLTQCLLHKSSSLQPLRQCSRCCRLYWSCLHQPPQHVGVCLGDSLQAATEAMCHDMSLVSKKHLTHA
jgi:hypothetical protein